MHSEELIPISQGDIQGKQVRTVNARELWEFLGVKRDFSNWIKARIKKYKFVEDQDFTLTVAKTGVRSNVIQKDYHLTIDMAKELSMVQNNAKGKEARQYFIQKEKEASLTMDSLLNDPKFALRLLQEHIQKDETIAKQGEQIVHLEKTKAHISDKKTASAMGTASGAVRRANKLEEDLKSTKDHLFTTQLNLKIQTEINNLRNEFKEFEAGRASKCAFCGGWIKRGWKAFVHPPHHNGGEWGDTVHKKCIEGYLQDRVQGTLIDWEEANNDF